MRKLTLTVIVALVATTLAAASMKAYVGYDKNVDFSTIKTFSFVDPVNNSVADQAPPVHEMITLLIIKQLQDAGLKRVEENADVDVTYYTNTEASLRMDVTLYNYSYSVGWWWSPLWGSGMDVSAFTKGTLVVDIWDPSTKYIVWRGAALAAVPEDPTPEKAEKTITRALELMGKKFQQQLKKAKR